MRLLIDMNLSLAWVSVLNQAGHRAAHWSSIGSPRATDREILAWAKEHERIVFTHDLDFGAILAATDADAPSVIQIRTEDPTPDACARILLDILRLHADALASGALVIVDANRSRVRLLPLKRS